VKKTFVILLIFLVFIAGYFYFNKPQPAQFKGCTGLNLVRISDDASELRGELIFHNPNKMRSQVGTIAFNISLNGETIGSMHDNFNEAIKGNEDFHYSFQIRFPRSEVISGDSANVAFPVTIHGSAGSDVLFANYTFPLDFTGTVKNIFK
jgi:hypothetical protein